MTWMALDALDLADGEHNEDVVDAVESVRAALDTIGVAYLDRPGVMVHADPERCAARFHFPHTAGFVTEFRHGDGYTFLVAPMGEYHGYIEDEHVGSFIAAALTGGLTLVRRCRGGVPVDERWSWNTSGGARTTVRSRLGLSAAWRRAMPLLRDTVVVRTMSYDRESPVVIRSE